MERVSQSAADEPVVSRVSFVMPTHNYAHLLPQAVESLLCQTHQNLEVIVIDDASTDGTEDVLNSYGSDPRVRVIRHARNHGHIRTYNEGLALARGEFVGLLSADDVCRKRDAVARQVAMFNSDPEVGVVYSALTFIDEENQVLGVFDRGREDSIRDGLEEFRDLIFTNYIPASGTLVRMKCHKQLGYYDERLPHAGDWELWLRLSTRYKLGYIAGELYGYRQHGTNMHHRVIGPQQASQDHLLAITNAFDALPPSTSAGIRALRRPALRRVALKAIDRERQSAHRRSGWFRAWQALRQFPEMLLGREYALAVAKLAIVTLIGQSGTTRLLIALGRRPLWRYPGE